MSTKTLVLFDFDGTITQSDTFPMFLRYCLGPMIYLKVLALLPTLLFYLLKIISAEKAKQSILSHFFKHASKEKLEEKGASFIEWLHLRGEIKEDMLKKIHFYKAASAEVAVVSASPDIWIRAFCQKHQLTCICTEMEYTDGIFLGKLKTPNCNKDEKKHRILQAYRLANFSPIIAYGNSSGDDAMLSIADIPKKV